MGSTVLVAAALFLAAPPDIEKARSVLPEHTLVVCDSCPGGKQAAFQLEEYKSLLGVGFELYTRRLEQDILQLKIVNLEAQVAAMQVELTAWESKSAVWETEALRLRTKWEEENQLRHKAEMKALTVWSWAHVALGAVIASSGALWGSLDEENPAPWVLLGTGTLQLSIGLMDAVF